MCNLFDGPEYEPPPPPPKNPPLVTAVTKKDAKAARARRSGVSALTVDLAIPEPSAGLTL